jgi:uncharacterized protein involved in exopolysaccharide biosynthesis
MQHLEMDWRDYLAVLRRRRDALLMTFGLTAGLGLLIAYVLPCRYLSTATLLVHAPPDRHLVPSVDPGDANQQIRALLQKNLTNPVVFNIIETLHLYPGQSHRSVQQRIETFRKALDIHRLKSELHPAGDGAENEIPFVLAFSHEKPALARQTVQVLADRLIGGSDTERSKEARQTVELLQTQTDEWQASIHDLENRISQFRLQHDGSLPEQRNGHLDTLRQLRDELRDIEKTVQTRQENRIQERETPDPEIPSRRRLEQQYQVLSSRYLPTHPDIKRLRSQLESLDTGEITNRMQWVQVRGMDPSSNNRRQQIHQTLALVERKMALIPVVEEAYGHLIRERDALISQHLRLREKLTDALLILNLATRPHGHTVTLLETPDLPARPDYSLKRKIILAGLFLGLMGGIGMVLLQDALRPRVHGQNDLIRATGITPLVMIPYLETPIEQNRRLQRERQHRMSLALFLMGLLVLLAATISWPLPESLFAASSNFTFLSGAASDDTGIPLSGPTP